MKRARLSAALCAALLLSSAALAQTPAKKPPPPAPPSARDVIDSVAASGDVEDEARGKYPGMQREETLPLGQIQRAWDKAPATQGIYNVEYSPDRIIKIRVRQFMPLTIVFPEWETISSEPDAGDNFVFTAQRAGSNKLVIRAKFVGADSTITVIGDSGNVYPFYVRGEGANSVNVPDVVVYVHAPPPGGGMLMAPKPMGGKADAKLAKVASLDPGAGVGRREATGEKSPDFVKPIGFDANKLNFDFDMSGDKSIAPKRVFSDGVFTWFDYGDKWDREDLPAVYRVVDGVDTPVNTRVKGSMLVAEAAGAFTLRNGQRTVCVRPGGWEPTGKYVEPKPVISNTSKKPTSLVGDDGGMR
jgi:ComB9 competence protein